MNLKPITLQGQHVRLEPMGLQHAEDLFRAGADESIWRYLARSAFTSIEDTRGWIESCMERNNREGRVQFAVVHLADNRAIGCTGYHDVDHTNRTLEIGMTWYGTDYQRTAVNTECKYLLLRHAFEELGALRVCLKADHRNTRSRRAIERIGAIREGMLRNHRIARDGVYRHSVYYGIIQSDWPLVQERLQTLLAG